MFFRNFCKGTWPTRRLNNPSIPQLTKSTSWRTIPEQIEFISAEFELDNDLISQVVSLCDCERDSASLVRITRKYDGKYYVSFPSFKKVDHIDKSVVERLVIDALENLAILKEKTKAEAGIKDKVSACYTAIANFLSGKEALKLTFYTFYV